MRDALTPKGHDRLIAEIKGQLAGISDSLDLLRTPTSTPAEQQVYYLPRDSNQAEMTSVYGAAAQDFDDRLDWFYWPEGIEARLYDRDGGHITDHTPSNGIFGDDHRTHKLLAPRVTAALQEIYDTFGLERFYDEGWHVWGGSHNYRPTTGGGFISTHARAAAGDWNPTENGFRSKTTTFSDEAIDIWERHGFLAGGRAWVNTPDWMHIQAAIPSISAGSYYAKNGLPEWIRPLA
jgi:hypothetical protein